jgi:hypothetical protein
MSVSIEYNNDGAVERVRHHLQPSEGVGGFCLHDSGGISIRIGTASVFMTEAQARQVIVNLTAGLSVRGALPPMTEYGRELLETACAGLPA